MTSSYSRRQLLRGGAAAAACAALGPFDGALADTLGAEHTSREFVDVVGAEHSAQLADPELVRALALEAIDAAKAAGARYADVRLSRTVSQSLYSGTTIIQGGILDSQYVAVGVRALVGDAWGFASSPIWKKAEMDVLAKNATEQAKANAGAVRQPVELGEVVSATGSWKMPVRIDPFDVPIEERADFLTSWMEIANNYRRGVNHGVARMSFKRQERALATTEGTYVTQTLYETSGSFPVSISNLDWRRGNAMTAESRGLATAGRGWELMLDAKLPEQVPQLVDETDELLSANVRQMDIGRYDIVFDAEAVASLLGSTIGASTELDRVMGFEANASGTSALAPPLAVLERKLRIASPLVTILGTRSLRGGVATVKWDDEGVEPDVITLVDRGVINDFQTTREQAAWLAPWYKSQNRPVRSHGCANSDSAMRVTMQHSPNLQLQPSDQNASFNEFISDTRRGIAIIGSSLSMDFQFRTGVGMPAVAREIINGRLGAVLAGLAYQIDSSFWRQLVALGGRQSVERFAASRFKGDPAQGTTFTVTAVPAKFRNIAVIDVMRRA